MERRFILPAKKQNVLSKSAAAKAVDETLKRSVLTTTSHSETTEYYTGPLPHPDALKKYDEFMPGLAERIVRMAEKEQAYRIDTTNREEDQKDKLLKIAEKESNHLIRAQSWGQLIGALISFSCIGIATYFAFTGAAWEIVIGFLAVPTASLIAAFIPRKGSNESSGKRGAKQEKED